MLHAVGYFDVFILILCGHLIDTQPAIIPTTTLPYKSTIFHDYPTQSVVKWIKTTCPLAIKCPHACYRPFGFIF